MKRCLFLLWWVACAGSLAAQSLSRRIDALLEDDLLRHTEVGITVYDLTDDRSLYRYRDEKLCRPASVEKVITAVAALDRLGTDYTFDTFLRHTGNVEHDTLRGNLYVVGGFDPGFMDEDLNRLAEAVERTGIRHVGDTIAADVSLTDSVYWGPGWSWDDAPAAFQPYLSPLMLNRGCVDVTVAPAAQDSLPRVSCAPVSGYYTVQNRGVSRRPEAGPLRITRNWMENGNRITISGNVSRPQTATLSVFSSGDFFFRTFRERLESRGIRARACAYADCPDSATTLCAVSRSLQEVLTRALKKSDNLCAEALFRHLAVRHCPHKRVTADDGAEAVGDFLKTALGLRPDDYRIVDGSGISLYDYLTPRLVLECLKYAYRKPEIFAAFYEALPIAGVDGTLRHRMKQPETRGRVRAKTGSVTGVSSLAGYVRAGNGHLLAFVVINQNVLKAGPARAFQDRLCGILAR